MFVVVCSPSCSSPASYLLFVHLIFIRMKLFFCSRFLQCSVEKQIPNDDDDDTLPARLALARCGLCFCCSCPSQTPIASLQKKIKKIMLQGISRKSFQFHQVKEFSPK